MENENNTGEVVTRIAPSPTGNLHIGTARTALFNYLFAAQRNGSFIVRIEDTDRKRSENKYEEDILNGLTWLGLEHYTLYRQSERAAFYREAIEELIKTDRAYISQEKSREDPNREVEVVRLRNPNSDIHFTDLIRGEISFNTSELGDFVIARSMNEPLYHLAVVVDDALMNITHVIRGEDHISNTPRQILIQEGLGHKRPVYAHIPLILAPDRSKLSKRRGGAAVSINEYRVRGYLPEALINYLALLGWNPGIDRELFTLSELIDAFAIEKVGKGGAIFNIEKLDWFNAAYISKLPLEQFSEEASERLPAYLQTHVRHKNKKQAAVFFALLKERTHRFSEITEMAERKELDYFFLKPSYEPSRLLPKEKQDPEKIRIFLAKTAELLGAVPDDQFNAEATKTVLWDYASEIGRGIVLWPVRFALSGRESSPDPFTLAEILGKKNTLERLKNAQEYLLHL